MVPYMTQTAVSHLLCKTYSVSTVSKLYLRSCLFLLIIQDDAGSVQIGILDELECVLQSVSSKRNTGSNICKLFIQANLSDTTKTCKTFALVQPHILVA